MSFIRIFINSPLTGRPDNSGERIARNLANAGIQIGSSLAVQAAKGKIYDSILQEAVDDTDSETRLENDGLRFGINSSLYSPYKTADPRHPVRNVVVFQTNDETVRVYLYDVKIDLQFENHIVKTPVTKRRGTIKEFISARDYIFSLNGSLISDSQYGFPIAELQAFLQLFEEEENISVSSVLFSQYNVDKVVLESASIPQSSAKYVNAIPFSIRLASDTDYQLVIEEER